MSEWFDTLAQIDALSEMPFAPDLLDALARRRQHTPVRSPIRFFTPSFKAYQSSEISACQAHAWPAVSITGGECKLQCDHCKAKILEPMIPARTPAALWQLVEDLVGNGAQGMLLTGGSNHRNEVPYGPYYDTIRRIKDRFPHFRIALHTGLVNEQTARQMAHAGVDVAMMDIIGSQETITQVYHLKRPVEDFERSLAALVGSGMRVVPHIVIGLHFGQLHGEWEALRMIQRHSPDAVVLVVVMPYYAPAHRPFVTPDPHEVGRFFLAARETLSSTPIFLGCARPAGQAKALIDSYAVMAGLDGIAQPADGVVELAARLDQSVCVHSSCCAMAAGEGLSTLLHEEHAVSLDLAAVREHERRRRVAGTSLKNIAVVTAGHCGQRR